MRYIKESLDNFIAKGKKSNEFYSRLAKVIKDLREQEIPDDKIYNLIKIYEFEDFSSVNNVILEGLLKGETYQEIGEKVGLSAGAVSSRIKKMRKIGMEIPDSKKIRNDKLTKKILEKFAEGKKNFEIKNELGCSFEKILHVKNELISKGVIIPTSEEIRNITILKRVVEGVDPLKIAEGVDLPPDKVSKIIQKMHIPDVKKTNKPRKNKSLKKIPDSEKISEHKMYRKILRASVHCNTYKKIGKKLGLPPHDILKKVRKIENFNGISREELAKMIVGLKKVKGATYQQIITLAGHYKVLFEVEQLLKSKRGHDR